MSDIFAFARQGEPPRRFERGDIVRTTGHDWDTGEVELRGTVTAVSDGGRVTLRVDDGHIIFVPARDCHLVSAGAP